MVGAMALLAAPTPADETTDRLVRVLVIATMLGAAIIAADSLLGYRLEALVTGRPSVGAATKYNRGIDYLVLIAWPQFAFLAWRRRYRETALLAVCLLAILLIGASLAARVAAVTGVLVFALAFWLPRIVPPLLACGTIVLAASLPFVLRAMADHRMALAPYLKPSGLQRLEIWDYMTARVFEHPLLGWGIAVANAVPVTPAEISSYVFRDTPGTYPHNQWIELWVETGAVGAALGLAFALVVIHRIQRIATPVRPFAYAAFASAIAVSCVNFEVTTDSWWAAMAATGYLFVITNHRTRPR
jgi:exopolysaccharide production protein ExoQ